MHIQHQLVTYTAARSPSLAEDTPSPNTCPSRHFKQLNRNLIYGGLIAPQINNTHLYLNLIKHILELTISSLTSQP